MREILFRGKVSNDVLDYQKEVGKWVYGFYRDRVGLPTISQFETNRCDYVDYEVNSETVGQYTGLCDKNGKKIFEGDIISIDLILDSYVVVYNNERARYERHKNARYMYDLEQGICDSYKVIGNIHDNLELLEN